MTLRLDVGFLVLGGVATTLLRVSQRTGWPETICEASAWSVAAIGVFFAGDMRARFELMLERMFHRDAIRFPESKRESHQTQLRRGIQSLADRGGIIGALALPGVLLIAYLSLFSLQQDLLVGITWLLEIIAAAMVGNHVGRGVVYGLLGNILKLHGASVIVKASHPDGAAGLKPAGEFYSFQACLLMIPTAFFAIWWLIIRLWIDTPPLVDWQNWYLVFFAIAIACELIAFAYPLLFFHQQMKSRKRELLSSADEIGDRIVAIKTQLRSESATNRIKIMEDELAGLSEQYNSIEELPTWPFDQSLRRRLAISNVTLVVPVIVGNLDKVKEALKSLFSG
ncbi:hypothetical protein [Stieleria varia]|uniref:Uncharacterized protein n=1 Tax=Stieleria varia TaxID=2528005 RepID=A0A5C6AP36_9BACT|nr:hypothetical protein [Stieleria varia]TWU00782.1 hypothetical protein Pla52n_41510 [Stieleria varia]